jgi:hypothetical protein
MECTNKRQPTGVQVAPSSFSKIAFQPESPLISAIQEAGRRSWPAQLRAHRR